MRPWPREGEPRLSLGDSLSLGDGTESPGKLEFPEQSTREEKAAQKENCGNPPSSVHQSTVVQYMHVSIQDRGKTV